jgi:hypothetical protein
MRRRGCVLAGDSLDELSLGRRERAAREFCLRARLFFSVRKHCLFVFARQSLVEVSASLLGSLECVAQSLRKSVSLE